MKAAEQYREYTSRHTSPEDGDARDSRKATALSSAEGSLPSSRKKVLQLSKNKRSGALSLPGKLPAPSILANFALRFGSGSPLPLINA